MKIKLLVILFWTVFGISNAQKTPTYSQFSVKIEKKTAKKINLTSHSKAKNYRTNLKNALANYGVNFAGKYIVAQWGCGSGCTESAIIDAKTGNVFFPNELQGVLAGGLSLGEHNMIEFKPNSNLLMIYGYAGFNFEEGKETQHGIYYYLWDGKKLKLLNFIKKKAN